VNKLRGRWGGGGEGGKKKKKKTEKKKKTKSHTKINYKEQSIKKK